MDDKQTQSLVAKLIGQDTTVLRVGVTSQSQQLEEAIEATAASYGATTEVTTVTEDEGRAQVADESLDALVTGTPESFQVVTKSDLDATLSSVFSVLAQQAALADQIRDLGGDPAAVGAAVAGASVDVVSLDPPPEVDGSQVLSGYIVGILLFISLQICGQMVAQGVVEEKTSRVVELLLATVRPWQLMAGKVLGIGAIGLLQVLVLVAAGVASATLFGLTETMKVDLGATAAWVIVWFLVGFTMYALLFAAAGALVSRQEEVAVVLLINILIIPVLVWFAGRVYSNAVLRTGGRIRLREALRAG